MYKIFLKRKELVSFLNFCEVWYLLLLFKKPWRVSGDGTEPPSGVWRGSPSPAPWVTEKQDALIHATCGDLSRPCRTTEASLSPRRAVAPSPVQLCPLCWEVQRDLSFNLSSPYRYLNNNWSVGVPARRDWDLHSILKKPLFCVILTSSAIRGVGWEWNPKQSYFKTQKIQFEEFKIGIEEDKFL